MEQTKYLTVQEAARAIGVTDSTIRAAILDKRLASLMIYGRKVIAVGDLEVYRQRARPDGQKRVGRPRRSPAPSPSLSDLVTQAAMAGPIGEIWSAPEEDEAWAHLAAYAESSETGMSK